MNTTNMTTAQLRNLAREADAACDWAKAADLYQQAHDVYPAGLGGGLAARDKEHLRHKASGCRTMVVHTEKMCEAAAA